MKCLNSLSGNGLFEDHLVEPSTFEFFGSNNVPEPIIASKGSYLFPIKLMFILKLKYGIEFRASGKYHSDDIYNYLMDAINVGIDNIIGNGRLNIGNGAPLFGKDGIFELYDVYHRIVDVLEIDKKARIHRNCKSILEYNNIHSWLLLSGPECEDELLQYGIFNCRFVKHHHLLPIVENDFHALLPSINLLEIRDGVELIDDLVQTLHKVVPCPLKLVCDKYGYLSAVC